MDGHRFDDLAKTLAATSSRRQAAKTLLAAAAGGALALLGRRDAGATRQAGCTGYGRVCANGGCCTTRGATCFCYPNGHCRCLCPPGAPYDPAANACRCTANADCDDRGNACTVDVCGPESRQCFHYPIPGCTRCRTDGDCAGGICCHGRCCPAGNGCGVSVSGEPLCCPDCRDHDCCDSIYREPDGTLHIDLARCYGSRQQICVAAPCRVTEDANGEITSISCDLPVIRPS